MPKTKKQSLEQRRKLKKLVRKAQSSVCDSKANESLASSSNSQSDSLPSLTHSEREKERLSAKRSDPNYCESLNANKRLKRQESNNREKENLADQERKRKAR